MAKRRTATQQRAYRDGKRKAPPRPYRTKPLVENTFSFDVQALVRTAYRRRITEWLHPTPLGNMQIKVLPSQYPPQWLVIGGVKFLLQRWEACGWSFLDRWVVVGYGGYRYTKTTQQMTKKARRLKTRVKLIEELEGGKRAVGYVQALPPDYVPRRRTRKEKGRHGLGMRKRRYIKLRQRLLYPDRKAEKQHAQRTIDELNRVLKTDPK